MPAKQSTTNGISKEGDERSEVVVGISQNCLKTDIATNGPFATRASMKRALEHKVDEQRRKLRRLGWSTLNPKMKPPRIQYISRLRAKGPAKGGHLTGTLSMRGQRS